MTAEDSRQVMEPFFTTKLDEGGTGLGLTICKSIIMEHKGAWISSRNQAKDRLSWSDYQQISLP